MSQRSTPALARPPRPVYVCTGGDCHAVWSTEPNPPGRCPDCQRFVEARYPRPAPKRQRPAA